MRSVSVHIIFNARLHYSEMFSISMSKDKNQGWEANMGLVVM